ncbi:hypothetical protein WICPIJ_002241 [Wickerhamomyces pijperi]|uniref:Cation efflux protein n=1 Tax=Wickerhamomyces pijperi TaxID=599730 RepID=A0A9P8Q9B5_WICPI|nr:hypothetical protein WICPIJ_002241 [Wickerhamomyces pijperi]
MALSGKELRIITLLVIDTVFFLIEAVVGYAVHSLALIADSFHMLNDIFSLIVALWAVMLNDIFSLIVALWAVRVSNSNKADAKYTYGWKRAEILGALINAVFLLALCFSILIEAIQRIFEPAVITNPKLILAVGTAGLISNIVGLFLFHDHGHSHGGSGGHSHSHGHGGDEDDDDDVSVQHLLPQTVVNETTALLESRPASSSSAAAAALDPYCETPANEYHASTRPSTSHSHDHSHAQEDHSHSHQEDHHAHDLEAQTNQKKKAASMNMHGVFLHVLGDALGNVGVMLTALFIWKTDYSWKYYSDPVISLVITAIIFSSALPLCKRASKILLQATPSTVSADEIQLEILNIDGIKSVHDFHIWNLTEDIFIASLHVEVDANPERFLILASQIRTVLHKHGVHSVTVQPEFSQESNGSRGNFLPNKKINSVPGTAYGERADQCIVDTATNCNTQDCL